MIRICKRNLWSIWFALFNSFIFFSCGMCKGPKTDNKIKKSTNTCKHDSFYKNDILMRGSKPGSFKYPPKKFPVVGKTTEAEVYEMYAYTKNPNTRFSYKKPVGIKIKNRKFKIDKFLEYIDYGFSERRSRTKDGGRTYDKVHRKYINFYILLHQGIVVYYTTSHFIKTENNKWITGKFNNGYSKVLNDENFPGHDFIGCEYWLQRPDALCELGYVRTQAECDEDLKKSRPWR